MVTGVARILKWLRMQRDLVDLRLYNWRNEAEKCANSLRQVEEWLQEMVDQVAPEPSPVHVITVLQQRMALDDQCQQWRLRQQRIQHEIQTLFAERDRLRGEMRKFELLQEEEERKRRKRDAIKLEAQVDDFVLRQWDRSQQDSETEPC